MYKKRHMQGCLLWIEFLEKKINDSPNLELFKFWDNIEFLLMIFNWLFKSGKEFLWAWKLDSSFFITGLYSNLFFFCYKSINLLTELKLKHIFSYLIQTLKPLCTKLFLDLKKRVVSNYTCKDLKIN